MALTASRPPSLPRRSRVTSPAQAALDALSLTVLRRLDGLLAGDHRGLLPGHGLDRGEAREYVPGDDPRRIDWAVTARTGDTHVRDAIADRELELWLVIDGSSSLAFGTGIADKYELGWAVGGAFALLAARGGNRVGAVRGSSHAPLHLPARTGIDNAGAMLTALRPSPPDGDLGDLAGAIDKVARTARPHGMTVVISDFLGPADWEAPLRGLGIGHDVIAVEVHDAREVELPDVGLVSVVDPETGRRRLLDTHDVSARRRYADAGSARRRETIRRLRRCRADVLSLRTDQDWVADLARFVIGRRTSTRPSGARP